MDRKTNRSMRMTYSAVMSLGSPLALPLLAWRTYRQTGKHDAWRERLGFIPPIRDGAVIWVHCASVGEVNAAVPLIDTIITRHPAHRLLVTTFTGAGRARAMKLFGTRAAVAYVPYDTATCVRRFLARAQPRVALILETELWPNLYKGIARGRIPLLVVSATVSERSYKRYRHFKSIVTETLRYTTCIAAQSEIDAERFEALGAPPDRITMSGNLKFDLTLPADIARRARRLRRRLFVESLVLTMGSIREGEEAAVIDAVQALFTMRENCTSVLAPRHPEQAAAIAALLRERGLNFHRRTQGKRALEPGEVLLLDTLGELVVFYAVADVAFVGGSLARLGGHNLLEPAALGCPVIAGPYLDNVADMSLKLVEAGALFIVHDGMALAETVEKLFRDELARERAGRAGRLTVEANRGALDKVLALVEEQLAVGQAKQFSPNSSPGSRK